MGPVICAAIFADLERPELAQCSLRFAMRPQQFDVDPRRQPTTAIETLSAKQINLRDVLIPLAIVGLQVTPVDPVAVFDEVTAGIRVAKCVTCKTSSPRKFQRLNSLE